MSIYRGHIGILGGGQLGRMLALAGIPLALRFRFLDPAPDAPASDVGELICAAYDDPAALATFGEGLDLVTYEFENVPAAAVAQLAPQLPVFPPPRALETAQDRLFEKQLFQACDIPVPPYAAVSTAEELQQAVNRIGTPALLKTRRFGYDGKGQVPVNHPAEAEAAWQQVQNVPCLYEQRVAFEREVSVLAARSRTGEIAIYPLVENIHRNGILFISRAPAPNAQHLQEQAAAYAQRVLEALDYVGLLAIEFFVVDNQLLANEMAPRVHNSGHWTIEGAETSQFAQHLRAVLGLPLGSTRARGHVAMINILGTIPAIEQLLALPGTHVHLYRKAPRSGRKLGHVTVRADSVDEREAAVEAVLKILEP
ncbi:5-(carboxyamino)imidazole ribonucleotide synthase [Thermorudis peleae]|uniref:5-(carboxyamino)imidazole ribonucleotide synthase n=1 Tax=Thermorudis peleae TaxID=1382356 RepID=UPI0005706601|nr:5-(carboxyamino)imidazole ribonucleotide synthase [Thermorudis peleae]